MGNEVYMKHVQRDYWSASTSPSETPQHSFAERDSTTDVEASSSSSSSFVDFVVAMRGKLLKPPSHNRQHDKLKTKFSRIKDNYQSLKQVTRALSQAGLESPNIILGIDFTKSNEWTGARSFHHECLHHIGNSKNPYEQAISIIGRTLSGFREHNLVSCYGFGDTTTRDKEVFSFYLDERPCNDFEEALMRYRESVPQLCLAGPTSFAPVIEMAIGIVERSGGQYHVLLIIADGQVTSSFDKGGGGLSLQEQETINAIVKASQYPLSIVLVGVGDGPWEMMQMFDDKIPARAFDNFQFVNFTEIMLKNKPTHKKEAEFALAVLMEIPSQYKATVEFQLLGCQRGTSGRNALPPPSYNRQHDQLKEKFSRIRDNYHSLEQVTETLAEAGLESLNMIFGIDFTKSNEWSGKHSFHCKCLHHIGDSENPYEQAISIIGRTLSAFDEHNLISCYGFGDATTRDKEVFSFHPDERSCNGFEEALTRYRELVPQLRLAGPTSFAPVIEMATGIVEQSGGQYHVLVIIADGQVTRACDTVDDQLSPQEQDTINAIVKASQYPLSIVLVGVGDGPWMMQQFDDKVLDCEFDKFQFVNFTEIMLRDDPTHKKEAEFALAALMEIPSQYKATLELQLLGRQRGLSGRNALPPPLYNSQADQLKEFFSRIRDNYHSLEQVTESLAAAGLESLNMIFGIDFTKSNEWTGRKSFNRKCLHHIGESENPYEQAISIIGRTLSAFDEHNLIPCYGFGDATTHDQEVFSFYPDGRSSDGFEEALTRYRELVPQLRLAGPTSFAPVIEMAIGIVERSGGQYHVLLIIADGQVTQRIGTDNGQLSPQEQDTINAIVRASQYPLSIILVGVGDGPFEKMRQFDENFSARAFNNFQFVNFTEIVLRNNPTYNTKAQFAFEALMKIPSQYKAILELQLLGRQRGTSGKTALPPPLYNRQPDQSKGKFSRIRDNYDSLEQVTEAVSQAGLGSAKLILGIDFTKSNEWTGRHSFNRKCLHAIGDSENPYEQAISIIGRTLSAFDEHNLIPCYGFGDATTHDQEVFSFYPDERSCNGFKEVLTRYRELIPQLCLSGPTSFAPIIEMATSIVERSGGEYHVLLIITDDQVTRACDTLDDQLSPQEQETVNAIVTASEYPLSIILVGVGDGSFERMRQFDDKIPAQAFHNFQFVSFTEIMPRNDPTYNKEAEFAFKALMEIPSQYKATLELQLLGRLRGTSGRNALPPPSYNRQPDQSNGKFSRIRDNYYSLEQVTKALSQVGLESPNLILGIDFTKSNEWNGRHSFSRKCLHDIRDSENPYERAISIIGRTLSAFDEHNLIPCYGFGDATTHDKEVFSFYADDRPSNGFEEVLTRYRELVPQLRLSGPTSFAPVIEIATSIVERSGGEYHVLLIIADDQVTRACDTLDDQLSPQEQDTVNAIVKASQYPLSIVLVGVGDGPFERMRQFADKIPARTFHNFQFVSFTEIMLRDDPTYDKEAEFALKVLMEVPSQYKETLELQLLGCPRGTSGRNALPPPV